MPVKFTSARLDNGLQQQLPQIGLVNHFRLRATPPTTSHFIASHSAAGTHPPVNRGTDCYDTPR